MEKVNLNRDCHSGSTPTAASKPPQLSTKKSRNRQVLHSRLRNLIAREKALIAITEKDLEGYAKKSEEYAQKSEESAKNLEKWDQVIAQLPSNANNRY